MDIEPATVDQVLRGRDGRYYEISGDVGGVVADLKQIDSHLGVRLSETGQHWVVYHQPDERTTHLITTAKAYQGATGVWLGLDKRLVERIRKIGSDSYDFVAEVDRINQEADRRKEQRKQEKIEDASERAVSELRRFTGRKSRAFFRKD